MYHNNRFSWRFFRYTLAIFYFFTNDKVTRAVFLPFALSFFLLLPVLLWEDESRLRRSAASAGLASYDCDEAAFGRKPAMRLSVGLTPPRTELPYMNKNLGGFVWTGVTWFIKNPFLYHFFRKKTRNGNPHWQTEVWTPMYKWPWQFRIDL